MGRLTRFHQLAAEVFGYSFDSYAEKVDFGRVRFTSTLPKIVRKMENLRDAGRSVEEIAQAIDRDLETTRQLLDRLDDALAVVDADTPAVAFREGVRRAIEQREPADGDESGGTDELLGLISRRAADLGWLLDESGHRLSDFNATFREWAQAAPDERLLGGTEQLPAEPHGLPAGSQVEQDYYATEEGIAEWNDFWEAFEGAENDARYAAARRELETNEHFDDEWAIRLVEEFSSDASSQEQWERLAGLMEEMRVQRPEAVEPFPGGFHRYFMMATLFAGRAVRDAQIERLFELMPVEPLPIAEALEMSAYHDGCERLVSPALEGWEALRSDDYIPIDLRANLVRLIRSFLIFRHGGATEVGALFEKYRQIFRDDSADIYLELARHVFGNPSVGDRQLQDASLEVLAENIFLLIGEFVPRLMEAEWSESRVALGFTQLANFYGRILAARRHGEANRQSATPGEPGAVASLEEALPVVFTPEEFTGHLAEIAGSELGFWYRRGVLVEMIGPWLEFLSGRGLVASDLEEALRTRLWADLTDEVQRFQTRQPDDSLARRVEESHAALV